MNKDRITRISVFVLSVLTALPLVGCSNKAQVVPGSSTSFAESIKWDAAYDVVVVGFGGAGAVASVTAAEKGAKVLLLEKAPEGHEGGNTRYAAQLVLAPKNRDDALTYYKALRGGYDNQSDEILETFIDGAMQNEQWLRDHGASSVTTMPLVEYPELKGSDTTGNMLIVDDTAIFTGKLWQLLRKNVTDHQDEIDVLYETPATHLIRDSESKIVIGVQAEKNGKTFNIRAQNGVVLACGGFENNEEMVENYVQMPEAFSKGALYNDGDGIKMAMEIGADLWHMSALSGPDLNFKAPDSETTFGYYLYFGTLPKQSTIFVGQNGKRFTDEAFAPRHGHVNNGGTWISLDIPSPAYAIFDENARTAGKIYPSWSEGSVEEIEKGWIVKADTIEELAQKTGVDTEGLKKQLSDYNSFCAEKYDPQYYRSAETLKPIADKGPYYAMKLVPSFTNTQGGPVRNEEGEVVDVNGVPIPHLYSAGELGSIFADIYNGGGNLSECIVFGRISGENAAKPKNDMPAISVTPNPELFAKNESKPEPLGAGEYIGEGTGMGGSVKVKVKLEGSKIISVEVLSHHETPNISDKAISEIPKAIVSAQSPDVDTVSGATVTSKAIIEAVKNALAGK